MFFWDSTPASNYVGRSAEQAMAKGTYDIRSTEKRVDFFLGGSETPWFTEEPEMVKVQIQDVALGMPRFPFEKEKHVHSGNLTYC